MEPVCLVLGAGAGIGGTVAAKFAKEGYHSYLCRRSDKEGLDRLIGNIEKMVVKLQDAFLMLLMIMYWKI